MKRVWTDGMIDRLRVLAGDGDTASEIASTMSREFGEKFTRNAIIGKMMREDIASTNARRSNLEWTPERVDKLRVLASNRMSATEISKALKFWSAKVIRNKCRDEKIKLKAHKGAAKMPPKVKAPPMATDDVPFLPPVALVVEYVPAARSPKTFLEAGQFECQNFLPDQDSKPAHERLVCANPVNFASRFRFCAACGERLTVRATKVVVRAAPAKFNAARKRSALTGAML
ncbi:MAG: hypothetical protein P0Y66_22280 [Candidatus Kaistia colombiensis]|nr:MAG: hypothetical protein P0Y66_22280 [Kaistia sp.]